MKAIGLKLLTTSLLLAYLMLPGQAVSAAVTSPHSGDVGQSQCQQRDRGSQLQAVDGCCKQMNNSCDMSFCSQCQHCVANVVMGTGLDSLRTPTASNRNLTAISSPEGTPPSHLHRPPIVLS